MQHRNLNDTQALALLIYMRRVRELYQALAYLAVSIVAQQFVLSYETHGEMDRSVKTLAFYLLLILPVVLMFWEAYNFLKAKRNLLLLECPSPGGMSVFIEETGLNESHMAVRDRDDILIFYGSVSQDKLNPRFVPSDLGIGE